MEEKNNSVNKLIKTAILVILIVLLGYLIKDKSYIVKNKIEYVYKKYIQSDVKQTLIDNEYRKKENYSYVKIDTNTIIKDKNQIKNAIYTFLDAGWKQYIVRCDPDYETCISDAKELVQNKTYLTNISNYVHPYNTYNKIKTTFSSSGKITFTKEERYSEEQIKKLNEKVNQIYKENYDSKKNVKDNIKIFHDYIINNTKYDQSDKDTKQYPNSSNAYGVLFDGVGICSGYTDAMQLFLEKMNVKNYRVQSDTHTWNLVYVEGKWLNLDLTWDDPIMSDGSNTLKDTYFLIDTKTLLEKEDNEHNFDTNIYVEAK